MNCAGEYSPEGYVKDKDNLEDCQAACVGFHFVAYWTVDKWCRCYDDCSSGGAVHSSHSPEEVYEWIVDHGGETQ